MEGVTGWGEWSQVALVVKILLEYFTRRITACITCAIKSKECTLSRAVCSERLWAMPRDPLQFLAQDVPHSRR